MNELDYLLFGYYPYICLAVFVVGLAYRFEREQYTWQASSSQMLRTGRSFNLASNLFHLGVLNLVVGHVVGLLVPAEVFRAVGMPDSAHQLMEIVMGGSMGLITLVGLTMLLYRRVTDRRVVATGSWTDLTIAALIWLALIVGIATLPLSWETRETGVYLHALGAWAQRIVTFRGGAVEYLAHVPWTFKAHMLLGMTVFLVFPFTRLVHVCSAPVGYLVRRYTQIVRARQV